jgi:hypothetical protein
VIQQAEAFDLHLAHVTPIWLPSGPITFQVSMLDTVIKVLGRILGNSHAPL